MHMFEQISEVSGKVRVAVGGSNPGACSGAVQPSCFEAVRHVPDCVLDVCVGPTGVRVYCIGLDRTQTREILSTIVVMRFDVYLRLVDLQTLFLAFLLLNFRRSRASVG